MTDEEIKGWRAAYEVMIANDPAVLDDMNFIHRTWSEYKWDAQRRLDGERLLVFGLEVYIGLAHIHSKSETDRFKAWLARTYYDDAGRRDSLAGDVSITEK